MYYVGMRDRDVASSPDALRRSNSSPAFHRYSRLAHSSNPASNRAPAAELMRDHHMGTATALASAEDGLVGCPLEDGQLPDGSAQGQIDQPTPPDGMYAPATSHEPSSAPASAPTKCARSTAFPASLRAARKLAFAVPIAAAAVSYLLVLDVANRNRTRPPFWGAVELQAQFMGLGIGRDPCPRSPPSSPPAPPPGPPALPLPLRAPTATVVGCGWWCGLAWPTHTSCGTSRWNRPEGWLFKYSMWSWLFVVELCQGHATVLLVLLQALLEFSFTMDAGSNKDFDDYWFCCSSYAYFFFWASGLVAAIDAALRRRRRQKGRGWAVPFGVLVGWLASALGTLIFDAWEHNHHFLAFLVGTLCALLNMLVVREHEAWGGKQRARVVVEPEEAS